MTGFEDVWGVMR